MLPLQPKSTWQQWKWRGTPHSPKPQHYWGLTIRLFSVISRALIKLGGFLHMCRNAVSVFSSLNQLCYITVMLTASSRIQTRFVFFKQLSLFFTFIVTPRLYIDYWCSYTPKVSVGLRGNPTAIRSDEHKTLSVTDEYESSLLLLFHSNRRKVRDREGNASIDLDREKELCGAKETVIDSIISSPLIRPLPPSELRLFPVASLLLLLLYWLESPFFLIYVPLTIF